MANIRSSDLIYFELKDEVDEQLAEAQKRIE